MALADRLTSPGWRRVLAPALADDSFARLDAFLESEWASGAQVLPAPDRIFAALNGLEPEQVRVVILGQDPYPTPGHAHGLAFSYRGDGALPRSLRNILAELEADEGVAAPPGVGDLGPWAAQGVLLLNAVLTVRAGESGAHRRRGWEGVTDAVLRHLAAREPAVVFLLWGNDARRKKRLLGEGAAVLEAGHPSPLSVRHFRGCNHFSRANALLGDRPVDWRLRAVE